MANGSGGGKIEGNKEMSRTENHRFGSNREFFPSESNVDEEQRIGIKTKQSETKKKQLSDVKRN